MAGMRIGVVMVVTVVVPVRMAVIMVGFGFAETHERQGLAVDKCVAMIVMVMMRVGMIVLMAVRVQRRPRQAVRLAEGLVAAG